jgi:hypothetical protein
LEIDRLDHVIVEQAVGLGRALLLHGDSLTA